LVESLKAELGINLTLIEADFYQVDMLKQHHLTMTAETTTAPPQLNLIFINSLRGIENVESMISHTEKIYYFVVNYSKETLAKVSERGFEESVQAWYSGGSTRFEDEESLMRYLEEETQLLEEGTALASIKAQRNVQLVNTENLEKDLLMNVTWAKSRLLPKIIAAPVASL